MPAYSIVTFGQPAKPLPGFVHSIDRARELADQSVRTGSCDRAKVYECDSVKLAKTADISTIRAGERVVYTA